MTELEYVNVYGGSVNTKLRTATAKKAAPVKRIYDAEKAKSHHGFEIVGVSLREIELAREVASIKKKDFDQQAFLNGAKPKRALKRIFFIPDSAHVALEILAKQGGWFSLHVRPILKG